MYVVIAGQASVDFSVALLPSANLPALLNTLRALSLLQGENKLAAGINAFPFAHSRIFTISLTW